MKTLDDVKTHFDSVEDGGSELMEVVVAAVEAEKTKGIDSSKKLRADLQLYGKYKDGLSELGYDGQVEVPDFVSGLKGRLESKKDGEGEVATLRSELTKERMAREKFEKGLREQTEKTNKRVLKDAVLRGLGDKAIAPDLIANNLIAEGKVRLLEDGQTVVFGDGTNDVSLEDGISKVLEERKELVKSNQRPGGGSDGSGERGPKSMSRSSFNKLSPRSQMAAIKEGTKIHD